jgi:hypothetical protein
MHKGTPYYFLGFAAYFARDYETALFYIDCAVEQDLSIHGDRWPNVPSGKFLLLDTENREQYAWPLVQQISEVFQSTMERLRSLGGHQLTINDYRDNLVRPAMAPAMAGNPSLRSAVTAFLTFLLEYRSRKRQLFLAPPTGGTGEPFYLHLFKGALLFETLLKTSSEGLRVLDHNPRAMLNDLLGDSAIYRAMGFRGAPQGLGAVTFDELLQRIEQDEHDGMNFDLRAIRATWGVRNTTGHSMAWPRRLNVDEYERVFLLILGALSISILTLHR